MKRLLILAIWLSINQPLAASELPRPRGDTIVAPDSQLELLFTRTADISGGLTEGPAVAPDGSIFFSDIPLGPHRGMILRFDPTTKATSVFSHDSGKSNGLIFDSAGHLWACEGAGYGGRRISRWNIESKVRETVVDRYMGKRFNSPNDICLDRYGRVYFTDPRYVGHEPRELTHRAIYRIEPDGMVQEVTHHVVKPNGIAISPDGKTLYVADHDNGTDSIDTTRQPPPQGVMHIHAFPLATTGTVGPRMTIFDFGGEKGCDGMTVDKLGHIYLTVRSSNRPGVMVITPAGAEVAFIPTGPARQKVDLEHPPVGLPSNVEFGIKSELNMLYVTVDTSLYRIPLKVQGFHVQYADP